MIAINSMNGQAAATTCSPQTWLSKFGFTAITPVTVTDGTCKGLFDVKFPCVDAAVVKTYFSTRTTFLKTRAVNAYDTNKLLEYTEKYFLNINKNIATGIFNTPNQTWLLNTTTPIATFFANLYASISFWVKNVFDKTQTNINPCFRAWNTISQGAICLFASDKTNGAASADGNNFLYDVDITKTGTALDVCLTLVDTYCTLTYGISISQTQEPYSKTYNWADGGVPSTTCTTLKTNYNCTTADCILARRTTMVSLFNTFDIPFVTSATNIVNLNNFLIADPIKQPSTYVPTQNAAVSGIAFNGVADTNDVNTFGTNSGQATVDFSTDETKLIGGYFSGTNNNGTIPKEALRTSFVSVLCLFLIWIR